MERDQPHRVLNILERAAGRRADAFLNLRFPSISRTTFATYLPAFFAAGVLCLIAAAVMLTIRNTPPAAAPAPPAA